MRITLKQAFDLAFAHERAGRPASARAIYADVLGAVPDHPGALLKLAEHDLADGAFEAARARLDVALAGATAQRLPVHDIWFAIARLDVAQHDYVSARKACERALEASKDALAPLRLAAWLDLEAGDPAAAHAACRRALERHPRDAETLHLLGKALKAMGAHGAARSALAQCAALSGNDPEVLTTWGALCLDAGDPAEAIAHLEQAVAARPEGAGAWDNLGLAYQSLGDLERAKSTFENAVAADPRLTPALANLVHAMRHLCEWKGLAAREQALIARLSDPSADPRWPPHSALSASLTPAQELAVARRWSRAVLPAAAKPRPTTQLHHPLRVGYLSADFREHATGRLMARLFEECDRNRLQMFAYDHGPRDGGELRARLRRSFGDAWREVGDLSDAQAAEVIRRDDLDVLVDCNGHTRGGRLGILASRPACVQLHYLAYPGTLGYDAIDGIVADEIVVPAQFEDHYHERVWRLPRCYMVNDPHRLLPPPTPRAEAGLPDRAIVLACFNQSYKLSPPVFSVWLEALRRVPGTVLWLLSAGQRMKDNLRACAEQEGIDPARLVFAAPMAHAAHIARLRCADLCLDTLPCGSHTTGCDAVWAGVPMLTCPGQTFASRVGASILDTAGLPDLVTSSLDEYLARLLQLASAPEALRGYRRLLERTRESNPLFDAAGFARDWEALLERAYAGTVAAR